MSSFEKWYRNAQHPQGQYEPWQHFEFRKLAYNAWKASRRYQKKNNTTKPIKGVI